MCRAAPRILSGSVSARCFLVLVGVPLHGFLPLASHQVVFALVPAFAAERVLAVALDLSAGDEQADRVAVGEANAGEARGEDVILDGGRAQAERGGGLGNAEEGARGGGVGAGDALPAQPVKSPGGGVSDRRHRIRCPATCDPRARQPLLPHFLHERFAFSHLPLTLCVATCWERSAPAPRLSRGCVYAANVHSYAPRRRRPGPGGSRH